MIIMLYKIIVDFRDEWDGTKWEYHPIYREFTDPVEANNYIQDYLENTSYGIVGVRSITPEAIELYLDIV